MEIISNGYGSSSGRSSTGSSLATRETISALCPTTFVQADTSTFKQVVQMLTGLSSSSETTGNQVISKTSSLSDRPTSNKGCSVPPIKMTAPKKQSFKLYERRNSLKNIGLMISPLVRPAGFAQYSPSSFSPRCKTEILSPSVLDFPSLVLSPITPLTDQDPFSKSSLSSEEEKAIAEKKFYLHPSPRTTPRGSQPQLLPLFPVTSPRISGFSS